MTEMSKVTIPLALRLKKLPNLVTSIYTLVSRLKKIKVQSNIQARNGPYKTLLLWRLKVHGVNLRSERGKSFPSYRCSRAVASQRHTLA